MIEQTQQCDSSDLVDFLLVFLIELPFRGKALEKPFLLADGKQIFIKL